MKSTIVLTLLAMLSSAGCETSGPVPDAFCDNARPIYLDRGDVLTRETLRGVIG
jgi:hypothetical protein